MRVYSRNAMGLCAVILSFFSGGLPGIAQDSILVNGSFSELNAQGQPTGWKGGGGQGIRVETGESGGRCLRVTVNKAATGEGQIGQTVALVPGHKYLLSGRLRSEVAAMGFFQMKLFQGNKEVQRVNVGRSTGEWAEVSQEIFVGEADRGEVLMRFFQTAKQVGKSVEFAAPALLDKGEKQFVAPDITEIEVTPTFESAGISLSVSGDPGPDFAAHVLWRKTGEEQWRRGADLVLLRHEKACRGSLLGLEPGTDYDVRCQLRDSRFRADEPLSVRESSFSTWIENVPVAREITLPPGEMRGPFAISDQGSEEKWIRYKGNPEKPTVIVGPPGELQAVLFDGAAHVILENVTIQGGDMFGVLVQNSHHIRITRCDISGWGDPGTPDPKQKYGLYVDKAGKLINWQSGVRINPGTSQVVVEENFIHSPRGTANSWRYGHPAGPEGVVINSTEGNHVVRNNDIIGSERHWWNDAIESMYNERVNGGPYRDTDISGNVLAFSNDDGTELDGGQINVRFFDNWVQWALCGVSCAPNLGGPSYVFDNLLVLGDERNKANYGFKLGGAKFKNQGLSILINNTVVSDNAGLSTGHYGAGPSPIRSRNNVFAASVINLVPPFGKHYDLDYDIFPQGSLIGGEGTVEANALRSLPVFRDASRGDFRLAPGSSGISAGIFLPGFHTGDPSARPDMGAFQLEKPGGFPARKITATPVIVPFEIQFGKEVAPAEVTLGFAPGAGTGWTARPNASWLKVMPSSGSVASTGTVRLGIDALDLAVGRHRGAVTFRTEQGAMRTVFVTLAVRPSVLVKTEIEAEDASFGGNFIRKEDSSASGGAYVEPPYDHLHPIRYGKEDKHDSVVRFEFEVLEDGLYTIRARVRIPGPDALNKDSCYIALDDGEPVFWGLAQAGKAEWNWQELQGGQGPAGTSFHLPKGRHTLRVIQRESGLQIDKISISNDI